MCGCLCETLVPVRVITRICAVQMTQLEPVLHGVGGGATGWWSAIISQWCPLADGCAWQRANVCKSVPVVICVLTKVQLRCVHTSHEALTNRNPPADNSHVHSTARAAAQEALAGPRAHPNTLRASSECRLRLREGLEGSMRCRGRSLPPIHHRKIIRH